MKILVTGCKGQLGNEMQLLEEKNPQHLYFNTDVEDLDITDEVAIERYVDEHEIDGIVNCAAYTAVDKAEENPSICRMLNATAPGFLAAAVERRGGWMIQISTDYVFDGTGHQPYVETDPTCPDSISGCRFFCRLQQLNGRFNWFKADQFRIFHMPRPPVPHMSYRSF